MSIPITAVLARLRQDLAEILRPDMIRSACDEAGYQWRNRLLDPVATVSLFLLQVLNGNTACRHVVHFGGFVFSASAYCQARIRLPLRVLQILAEKIATFQKTATDAGSNRLGHRVWIEDGSSFSMSDKSVLRDHFGQPTGQRLGCGFRSRNGSLFSILSPACFYALTWFSEIADSDRTHISRSL